MIGWLTGGAGVQNSFLLTLLQCVQHLILTCNQVCIICDKKLQYAGLKPCLCDSALCNFRYPSPVVFLYRPSLTEHQL
jgi:hypothetical protein